MSKCSIPSDEVPALRRSRRRAGFHLAWPVSPVPASSLAQPYNSSWFVTVYEERHGSLKAHSRLLSSTPDPLMRALMPAAQSNIPKTTVEHTYDNYTDSRA
jgi:hypothetical protein